MRKKKHIISLLKDKDYPGVTKLCTEDKKVFSLLLSLTYDKEDPISWRAMEAIGIATGEIAKTDRDAVREIANRLLWMLRDESGGIAWSNPEILGEIIKNNPQLCADLAPIIASFHEELMFIPGVLWALGRIGRLNDSLYEYALPIIKSYLDNSDDRLRGYGAWAVGEMNGSDAAPELEKLKSDEARVAFYQNGDLTEKSVGEIASEALSKISSN